MAQITFTDLVNTLAETRSTLLSASKGDGIVSRADLKNLLQQTEDPLESRFIEFFYGFLLKLENRSGVRVTEEVIDRGISFLKDEIIPNFEIRDSFSQDTNQRIAQVHEAALPVSMELLRTTKNRSNLSPREVYERIIPLSEGLFFDDYGSEAAISITAFFLEHPLEALSPQSFAQAIGVDPNTPKGKVERFDPADRVLLTFVEQHVRPGLSDRARSLVELMQTHLSNPTLIVLGQDNHPDLESNHPVYVVGMGQNGNLAGFESTVIWT